MSPSAASIGESTVYLRAGEELTVADLVRATLIPSANDAAQALAFTSATDLPIASWSS